MVARRTTCQSTQAGLPSRHRGARAGRDDPAMELVVLPLEVPGWTNEQIGRFLEQLRLASQRAA